MRQNWDFPILPKFLDDLRKPLPLGRQEIPIQSVVVNFLCGIISLFAGEIANDKKSLNRRCLGWNEMRLKPLS
jgi:hypothetical protein